MNNEIASITLPVTIEGRTQNNVTYSYSNIKNSDAMKRDVDKFLNTLTRIFGIRTEKNRENFKSDITVDHEAKTAKTFYIRSDVDLLLDEIIDDAFLEDSLKVVKNVVDVIDILNSEYSETGDTFDYLFSPNITTEFEIKGDTILYRSREAPSLINDLLNLLTKQPDGIVLSSKGVDVPFKKSKLIAPVLKGKTDNKSNRVEMIGNIALIQSYPSNRVKIVDQRSNNHFTQSFDITNNCFNFKNIIGMSHDNLIKLVFIKSTRTEQYNIAELDILDEPMKNNMNLSL